MAATTTEDMMARIAARFATPVPTAPKAHAAHQAYLADIERIHRQTAEAIKTAPGYSAKLGAFVCPKDAVAFIDSQRKASVSAPQAAKAA